jgi:hypothetical protein
LAAAAPRRGAGPPARLVRIQRAGDVTYLQIRFDTPQGLANEGEVRLVPQDNRTRNVCVRPVRGREPGEPVPGRPVVRGIEGPADVAPVVGLEFVGVATGPVGEATFLLQYPVEGRPSRLDFLRPQHRPRVRWVEVPITIDLARAQKVAIPAGAEKRKAAAGKVLIDPRMAGVPGAPPGRPVAALPAIAAPMPQSPGPDDLEGLWADAQAGLFARMDTAGGDFGFYGLAAAVTARKFGIPVPITPNSSPTWMRGREVVDRQLFETTTGAAAITESLQLQRMLNPAGPGNDKDRTVAIETIQGIDIAEHPWDKMMGDRKPADEPLARLVPADNYYVSFNNVRKLLEFNDLLEQWGTSLVRAYEVHSRDYRLKERYQQQLCLESTVLARTLGPVVLRGVAITGHDLYLREGSDVAIVFHVRDRAVFLSAVNRFIDKARARHGEQLKEEKEDYAGVTVESYVTPRREVSLHRAAFDDFVVYSNSAAGLRRVLDAHGGKIKTLADSLDFRYMRTIFRSDDKEADGFVFLSDPFIRQLVGPAGKIKEKRRLEALASLYMLQEGALYHAWLTGKPPASHAELVAFAGLRPEETPTPQGRAVSWDPETREAVSDSYNTTHFATPLVELAIDKVTPQEAQAYGQFRMEYLGLWRRYFDPIGMRIAVTDKQVKLDTYILPLIQNTSYNELRRVAGGGTVRIDPGRIAPTTLGQFVMHLSPTVGERTGLLRSAGIHSDGAIMDLITASLDPVGNWFLVRVDESSVYARLAALLDREEGLADADGEEVMRLIFQMPVAIGVDVRNPLSFGAAMATLRTSVLKALPGGLTWEPLEEAYKGVSIVRIKATEQGLRQVPIAPRRPGREPFLPALYYAMIDGGFYLSPSEAMLRSLIDQARGRDDDKGKAVEVNSSLYLSPRAADKTRDVVQKYLEAQIHEQALNNDPIWYALYHSGVIAADADPKAAQATADRWLGFVPASPDGSAYTYDRRTDDVINARHGSLRRPQVHQSMADDAPLNRLLDQLASIRADLQFREDGIHTVLTVDRRQKPRAK